MLKTLEEKIQIKGNLINKIVREKNILFSKINHFLTENKNMFILNNKLSLLDLHENHDIKAETIQNSINQRSRALFDPRDMNYQDKTKPSLNFFLSFQEDLSSFNIEKGKQSRNCTKNFTPTKSDSYFDISAVSKKIYNSISKLKSPDLNIQFARGKPEDSVHTTNIRNFHHKTFQHSNLPDKNEKLNGIIKSPSIFSPIPFDSSNKIFSSASPSIFKLPNNLENNEYCQKNLQDHIKEYREKLNNYINSNDNSKSKISNEQNKSFKDLTHNKIRQELIKMYSIQKSYFKLIDMYQKRERIFCSYIDKSKNEMKFCKLKNETLPNPVSILGKKMQSIITLFLKCEQKVTRFETRFKNFCPLIKQILNQLFNLKNEFQILKSKLYISEQNDCLLKLEKMRDEARGNLKRKTEDIGVAITNLQYNYKLNKFSNFSPLNIKHLSTKNEILNNEIKLKNNSLLRFQSINNFTIRSNQEINNNRFCNELENYEERQKEIILNQKICCLEKQLTSEELKRNELALKMNKEKVDLINKYESIILDENQRMNQLLSQIIQMNNEIQIEICKNQENSEKVIYFETCIRELSDKLLNKTLNEKYKEMTLLVEEINRFKNESILCPFKQIEENMEKILTEYKEIILERDNLKLIIENKNIDISLGQEVRDFLSGSQNIKLNNLNDFEGIPNELKAKNIDLCLMESESIQLNNLHDENSSQVFHIMDKSKERVEYKNSNNQSSPISKQDITKTKFNQSQRIDKSIESSRIIKFLKLAFLNSFKNNLQKKLKLFPSIHNITILNVIQVSKTSINEKHNYLELEEKGNKHNFTTFNLHKISIMGTNTLNEFVESIKFLVHSIYNSEEYGKILEEQIHNKNISDICLIVARDFLKLKVNNELLLQNQNQIKNSNENISKLKSEYIDDRKSIDLTKSINQFKTFDLESQEKRMAKSQLLSVLSKRSLNNNLTRNHLDMSSQLINTNNSKKKNKKQDRQGIMNCHFRRNSKISNTLEFNKKRKKSHRSSKNLKLKEVISKLSKEVDNMKACLLQSRTNDDYENHRNL